MIEEIVRERRVIVRSRARLRLLSEALY